MEEIVLQVLIVFTSFCLGGLVAVRLDRKLIDEWRKTSNSWKELYFLAVRDRDDWKFISDGWKHSYYLMKGTYERVERIINGQKS